MSTFKKYLTRRENNGGCAINICEQVIKKVFHLVPVMIIAGTIIYGYTNSYYLRGVFIEFSDYKEVSEGVYVDQATTVVQVDSLLETISIARARNQMLWKEEIPVVTIIFSSTPQNTGKLSPSAAYSYATFFGSFLGGFIAVQPAGLNADILSHELCHAILHEKMGWYKHYFKIPAWFDEGLAMQVDYRENFNQKFFCQVEESGINIAKIGDAEFYDQEKAYYHYLAAKKAVNELLIEYKSEDLSLTDFILQMDFHTISR